MSRRLRNGAREIARLTGPTRQWVMAETGGVMPFVTWECDDDGNTYWGHYFATHDEAAADLIDRADFRK